MNTDALKTIRMQIMWNRLIAVVEEQAQTLMRTAFSPIVREAGDLSAGVFDPRGRMLAQAVTGTPGHVNSMAESVNHFLRHFPVETMHEGDIYITNDPWMGTGHLNDFVLTTPCFHRGRLVGLFSCTSHLTDIGGIGFGPDATDVHMEGIYIPMLKLADRGVLNETLMAMVRANTRQPVESEGDVYSLAACNDVGCERLVEMMTEFDLDDLDELGEYICESSRRAVLDEIAKLPKGEYRSSMRIDGYERPIDLVAKLDIADDGITVDYDGTSPKSNYGVNVPMAYTSAYTCFGLSCIVSADVPNNWGSLAPFKVRAPEGCVLNAPYPAAVCSRHIIGQMLPDVVFGALTQAVPERVPAEGAACLWNVSMRGESDRAANQTSGALFMVTGGVQRRHRCAAVEGRTLRHRVSERGAGHAGRDQRVGLAGGVLAQGAAARLRRPRAPPRRSRAGHRDRVGHRRGLRASRLLRSHHPPSARALRWPRRRPRRRAARLGCGPERQGDTTYRGRRAAHSAHPRWCGLRRPARARPGRGCCGCRGGPHLAGDGEGGAWGRRRGGLTGPWPESPHHPRRLDLKAVASALGAKPARRVPRTVAGPQALLFSTSLRCVAA